MGLLDYLFGGQATQNLSPTGANYNTTNSYLKDALANTNQSPLNFTQANQINGQENQLGSQLNAVASGGAKGAGELAADRTMQQGNAAQQAMASMARGTNAALAARNAARTQAGMTVAGAGQAQQAALQDQTTARSQLAGLLGQQQQGALSQQQLTAQQWAQQQQAAQGYLGQLMGQDQSQFNNQAQMNQLGMSDHGIFPYLLQTGGSLGAAALH